MGKVLSSERCDGGIPGIARDKRRMGEKKTDSDGSDEVSAVRSASCRFFLFSSFSERRVQGAHGARQRQG